MNSITIFTDGSYRDGVQGWGFVALNGDDEVVYSDKGSLSGEDSLGMNNIGAEIAGVVNAIRWAHKTGYKDIEVVVDYTGLQKWADGEWKTKKRNTRRYARFIRAARDGYGLTIKITWVRGHSGNTGNEIADRLAGQALELGSL